MSKHEPINFLPPDEPTAAYPIGGFTEEPEVVVSQHDLPEVQPDPPSDVAPPASDFNPAIGLAIIGVFMIMGLLLAVPLALYLVA